MARLEEHGVVYSRVMTMQDRAESAIGRGWKSTFNVSTKREAEAALQREGCKWEWLDKDALRQVSAPLPAVRTDKRTGKRVFFNQVWAAYTGWADEYNTPEDCVRLGDGSLLPAQFMRDLGAILDKNCVAFDWHHGDVLLVDNVLAMHARTSFTGKRRILASLAR
mmetsp:Transcript_15969/g.39520  ORF Transcript_15969/g.39520 Transcript_15969/m.39520 type:complete len:165 (+) Transcript_15969:485-979(+)